MRPIFSLCFSEMTLETLWNDAPFFGRNFVETSQGQRTKFVHFALITFSQYCRCHVCKTLFWCKKGCQAFTFVWLDTTWLVLAARTHHLKLTLPLTIVLVGSVAMVKKVELNSSRLSTADPRRGQRKMFPYVCNVVQTYWWLGRRLLQIIWKPGLNHFMKF